MGNVTTRAVPPVPAEPDLKWMNGLRDTVNTAFNGQTTTAQRPANPPIGFHLFDTTIGQPIWCKSLNPTVWVNGAGTVV